MWRVVLDMLFFVFKWLFYISLPFFVPIVFFYIYYFIRGKRFKKGEYKKVKYGSKLKRLFWDFPHQFVLDSYARNPDEFREYGVHVVAGEQGSGKTITVVYLLLRWQKMYPKLVIKTNMDYKKQDGEIYHWKDIVGSNNGVYGEVDMLDEIQNWFNSLQSKNFPVEMLTEITQQRKQRKVILSTSQVFSRVAKPIREQVSFLYEPITIFGCLTIVRVYKPHVKADGLTDEKKLRRIFFFVHTKEIRESFDTYKKIEKMVDEGFKEENSQIHRSSEVLHVKEVK